MQKASVLIVDDAQINRELLEFILQDRYQVFQAENGAQAIEMIESQERIYRLVCWTFRCLSWMDSGSLNTCKDTIC